jgi:hypothetical protein
MIRMHLRAWKFALATLGAGSMRAGNSPTVTGRETTYSVTCAT